MWGCEYEVAAALVLPRVIGSCCVQVGFWGSGNAALILPVTFLRILRYSILLSASPPFFFPRQPIPLSKIWGLGGKLGDALEDGFRATTAGQAQQVPAA